MEMLLMYINSTGGQCTLVIPPEVARRLTPGHSTDAAALKKRFARAGWVAGVKFVSEANSRQSPVWVRSAADHAADVIARYT
jgi:hypothetical protein